MNNTVSLKKIIYACLVLLTVVSVIFIGTYTKEKRENRALRLKVLTLNKGRRAPAPWSRILPPPVNNKTTLNQTTTTNTTTIDDQVSRQSASPVKENEIPVTERTTTDLATFINTQMNNIQRIPRTQIDKIIEAANEIIARSPDIYSAYKAKLIAMLVEEGKFNTGIDETELNDLLETMAGFEINTDSVSRREAALISSANIEADRITTNLETLEQERIALMNDESLPENARQARLAALEIKASDLNRQMTELEDSTSNNLSANSNVINEEIVQIPFMRMMAKEDYDGVIENAQTFIEQFPSSPLGHYYLIRAYEMSGRSDEAMQAMANSKLGTEAQNQLQQSLALAKNEDPKRYWQKLKF